MPPARMSPTAGPERQPPVKTVTWFHTGVSVLAQYEREYFPRWSERPTPGAGALGGFQEHPLPEPDFQDEVEDADELREALRAVSLPLRQEIMELDVDALSGGSIARSTLLSGLPRLPRAGGSSHAATTRMPCSWWPRARR